MALTLTLDPNGERLVADYLRSGRFSSPEEVVAQALETLARSDQPGEMPQPMTPAEAVADILAMRVGLTLGGLKIKDLINEGRKY